MEPTHSLPHEVSAETRRVFARHIAKGLPQVSERIRAYLLQRSDEVVFGEEAQRLLDAFLRFKTSAGTWEAGCQRRLDGLAPPDALSIGRSGRLSELVLVGEDAVENQILAARAALVMVDKSSDVFNELRVRIQHLDNVEELDKRDSLQALQFAQWAVEAWLEAGLLRLDWQICQTQLHTHLGKLVVAAYTEANEYLIAQGVLPSIDLRQLLRRTGPAGASMVSQPSPPPQGGVPGGDLPTLPAPLTHVVSHAAYGSSGFGAITQPAPLSAFQAAHTQVPGGLSAVPFGAGGPLTGPQEVASRLMAFLGQQLAGGVTSGAGGASASMPLNPSANHAALFDAVMPLLGQSIRVDWSSLESGWAGLKLQSRALKKAAQSDQERVVIELVALIFENILSEDRLPSTIRVWFARLQMPVLRAALADPSFLTAQDHPARRLMDRMGSCVLGFDPSVKLDALEAEIKRVVQVIEQYPEAGREVFQLMLQEFEAFVATAVEPPPVLRKVTDVAGKLEQRETLTVQYTIEMRKLLTDAPVHDTLRDFLFHVWTSVMAQAAVTYGDKDDRAVRYRALAADLLWAASAKPTRQERAQVIARVPGLMALLREGLALLGGDAAKIEVALQPVSDALAAAFMSKAAAIDPKWLAQITQQLASLEELLSSEAPSDWTLSRESVELLTGEQVDNLTVLPNPEISPPRHMLAWAAALPVGSWYTLEHNGKATVVQLAWVSPRKQLYLFVNSVLQSWLMQQGRVSMYLKSGLLRPGEAEALTTRATRQALGKLEANPERLLQTD